MSSILPTLTRRTALAAAAATLAWRPAWGAPPAADSAALHVLNRLAFGPAPGDVDRVTAMGVGAWIAEQLQPDRLALPPALVQQLDALRTPRQTERELVAGYREMVQAAREEMRASVPDSPTPARQERRAQVLALHVEAGEARLLRALNSPRQLEEVMVDFWFNHFNVFEGKGLDRVLVESYEREAIRPNVFGQFRDLLGATAKHPAMLFYLDNWLSVAPGYQPRRPGGRPLSGLNENYAREVMELHTLGVDGGYTQSDVTELARILTGWTITPAGQARRRALSSGDRRGAGVPDDSIFGFDPARHDNGTKTWLGHAVEPAGQAEGEFALDVLARHPATATHIATQLARHFVADAPPPALVRRLAQRYAETDGDVRAVLRTLFDSPEFRDPAASKFKTPYQYVLSAVRATGIPTTNVRPLMATMTQLGQPLFGCQTPDGYKDTEADWLNPNAITQRVNFATALASGRLPLVALDDMGEPKAIKAMQREVDRDAMRDVPVAGSTPPVDPAALLVTLGSSVSGKTRATVARSQPALQAALVLGSPDFMRR